MLKALCVVPNLVDLAPPVGVATGLGLGSQRRLSPPEVGSDSKMRKNNG